MLPHPTGDESLFSGEGAGAVVKAIRSAADEAFSRLDATAKSAELLAPES